MSRKATDWAWGYKTPNPSAKLVLLALSNRACDLGECFPSVQRLEIDTGLNRKTIIKAIQELELLGAVIDSGKRKGATQRVKVYRVNIDTETVPETESFQKRNSSKNGTLNSPKNGTLNSPKSGTQNQSVESVIESLLDHSANDPVKKAFDKEKSNQQFEQFWKHYPTKTGKQKALKAWCKFMRGKNENKIRLWLNLMLEYYHQQLEAGTLGYENIHGSTFINQRRWEDNPEWVKQYEQDYLKRTCEGSENAAIS